MLVAACNGCSCGRPDDDCTCTDVDRARYQRRLSGPLLDRMDLVCTLRASAAIELAPREGPVGEPSAAIRRRVVAARERQRARLAGTSADCNAGMDGPLTRDHVSLDGRLGASLGRAVAAGALSVRGHDRVLRLARTIADLDGREEVAAADVEEALGYRLPATEAVAA
jgi:magnesium chelatase family protein